MFSLQRIRRRGQNRFCTEAGEGKGGTMHTHVSKCKNNKRKEKKMLKVFKYPNSANIRPDI
jgi:hypothetical protein